MRSAWALTFLAATGCSGGPPLLHASELETVLDGREGCEFVEVDEEIGEPDDDPALVGESQVEGPDDLYDADRLPIFKFTLEPHDEERLAAQPREYVPAELELVDGDTTEHIEVGLRLKGAGSFKQLDGKAAFRIKIDEYHSRQRLRGRRSLTLNNMVQDGSLMSERLAYHTFREMGAPAPKVNHAMVYVNEVYFGLYANIETPNEDFLARWFEDPDRNLYEGTLGLDFDRPGATARFELETNERQIDEREHLFALEEACTAGDLERARELVDWPRFLLFSALEASVNQVDGYSYAQSGANNYRVYDAEDGFVFIPAGLDWAFGMVATQDGSLYVDPFWVRPNHGVLMRMCLADPECTRDYREVLEGVASRWDGMKLEAHLDRWVAQTRTATESDERRESPLDWVLANHEVRRTFIRGRAQALLEALERH